MSGDQIKVVTRGIILDGNGRVLLGKRAGGMGVGRWALVGGKPDEGETPEEAIKREIKEELGIEFTPELFKEEMDEVSTPGQVWRVIYFSGPFTGEFKISDYDISEIKFIGKEDLDSLDIAFGHDRILKEFLNQ